MELTSERKLTYEQQRPSIKPERLSLASQRRGRQRQVYVQTYQYQHIINLPLYLYGYATELVKASAQQQQVACKFNVYASLLADLQPEHIQQLRQSQLEDISPAKQTTFLSEEHQLLSAFISNNLIVEVGTQVIDIVNQHPKDQNSHSSDSEEESSEEEDSEEEDDFYYRKLQTFPESQWVTYHIHGTFPCQLQLDNTYFPYLQATSSIRLRVRQLTYGNILIRYNMLLFEDNLAQNYQQFGFRIAENSYGRFGIYSLNCCEGSYELQANKKQVEVLSYPNERDGLEETGQKEEVTRGLEFRFQLYCFNLPFMLRQVVPQLVLCLVSLLSYFTDTDVFPNVILLSIALIELLSNFRSSQYDTSNFNIFQLNLLGIIVINFMLLIIGTNNFYSSDRQIIDIDAQHWCFWVAVAIGIFFIACNILIFAYFGWKAIKYPQMNTYKLGNRLWMWHEEMVREMINQFERTHDSSSTLPGKGSRDKVSP